MGLSDITGIFSRFFVVGFYVPSFFTLAALVLVLGAKPSDVRENILVIGGVALLVALVLVGCRTWIWFKFSGYWFQQRHRLGTAGLSDEPMCKKLVSE